MPSFWFEFIYRVTINHIVSLFCIFFKYFLRRRAHSFHFSILVGVRCAHGEHLLIREMNITQHIVRLEMRFNIVIESFVWAVKFVGAAATKWLGFVISVLLDALGILSFWVSCTVTDLIKSIKSHFAHFFFGARVYVLAIYVRRNSVFPACEFESKEIYKYSIYWSYAMQETNRNNIARIAGSKCGEIICQIYSNGFFRYFPTSIATMASDLTR